MIINRFAQLFLIVFLLTPMDTFCTGFGWYAKLVDYQKFESDFKLEIQPNVYAMRAKNSDYGIFPQSDYEIFEFLDGHSEVYDFEDPNSFVNELIWHQAFMAIAKRIAKKYPDTPLKFMLTGRLFQEPGKAEACRNDFDLIHGSCRTYILYSDKEANLIFWQLTELLNSDPNFTVPLYFDELVQIRDVFKEAALKNKGVYLYGHD